MLRDLHLPLSASGLLRRSVVCTLMGTIFLLLSIANSTLAQSTPSLSINDSTGSEGGDDPLFFREAIFTITLSAPSQQTVQVTASTQDGTAIGNVDYAAGSEHIVFQPGETSQTLRVYAKGDIIVEGTEQFFVNLSNPVNATIADGQGVCTIIDDDALVLLTEPNVQRAAALDSVTFARDTFAIFNDHNFSSDQRTRIILPAIGLKFAQGEIASSAVTATGEDSQGTVRTLDVEFVQKVPNFDWLWQVTLRLNNQITLTGDVKVKISLHGQSSNTVLVGMKP